MDQPFKLFEMLTGRYQFPVDFNMTCALSGSRQRQREPLALHLLLTGHFYGGFEILSESLQYIAETRVAWLNVDLLKTTVPSGAPCLIVPGCLISLAKL